MWNRALSVFLALVFIISGTLLWLRNWPYAKKADLSSNISSAIVMSMRLSSGAFAHEGNIPSRHTCDGTNVSPPLSISDVPEGAKSLAIIMEDPDVPTTVRPDGMWDHWVVWNIASDTREIAENIAPGVIGANTGGKNAYTGPCPPDREHRYFFKLFALDTELALAPGAKKTQLLEAIEGHILTTAELMGRYERKQ